MVFKRLDFRVVIIGILSSITGAIFLWSLTQSYLRATSAGLLILWLLQMTYLVYYMHSMRKDIETLLKSIKAQDVSLTFPARRSSHFIRKIYTEFNEITSNFRLVRKEREQEHQFFMHTIRHVGTGLLAFDEKGRIHLFNSALQTMLQLDAISELVQLEKINPDLPNVLTSLHPGEQYLFKMDPDHKTRYLSILTSGFKLDQQIITLASFRDISRDLDKTELEAWHKIIRVVIHEIISSVVPFRLLSSKLLSYLKPEGKNKPSIVLEGDSLKEAVSILESMHNRSIGLNRFAESYKALSQLPIPKKRLLLVSGIFKELELYFSEVMQEKTIEFSIYVDPVDLKLHADEQLMIQMFINLINNAIQAMKDTLTPKLSLRAFESNQQVILEIEDNGHGIPEDNMDSIFIPFFSTREEGSGIGLSLSKQIMNAHQARIIPLTQLGQGTVFQLLFQHSDHMDITDSSP